MVFSLIKKLVGGAAMLVGLVLFYGNVAAPEPEQWMLYGGLGLAGVGYWLFSRRRPNDAEEEAEEEISPETY